MSTTRRLRRTTSLAGGVLSAFIIGVPFAAQAQDAPAQEPGTEVEEIVVTGSRIPRPNLEQPAPVATISQEAIQDSGTVGLGEIISELPGMSRTDTVRGNADFGGGEISGLSFPNLRSLGAGRTLTLVDGKRHVGAYTGTTAVDVNSIPNALVERVETSTGGASAVYGSDAVSGVVNIILRDDFDGVEASAQYGASQDGVAPFWTFDATIGGNFNEGRGNATLSFLAAGEDEVKATDIYEFGSGAGTVANPADTGPNDGIPDFLYTRWIGSEFIDERGVLYNGYTGEIFGFDANGNPISQPARIGGDNSFAFGGFGSYCDSCFFVEDWQTIIPESKRVGFVGTVGYDITDNIRFSLEAKHIRAEFHDLYQPSFRFFQDIVQPDNAFLTPAIVAAAGFSLPGQGLYINRFTADAGKGNGRDANVDRNTTRFVAGLEGDFDAGFAEIDWEASYVYGEVNNTAMSYGNLIPGNYAAAIDAVFDGNGDIVCRSTIDPSSAPAGMTGQPCVPYNPFIRQNSQEAADYISHTSTVVDTLTQEVFQATFAFDTSRFLNLPGGPVGIAGGFEQREEFSERINDSLAKAGLSDLAPQPDATGGFDVSEWFIETNLPILADHAFAHRLSVDAAFRRADYSHAGEAEAWKVGFLYAPIRDITFRGTIGEAVRAPNITEAFLPPSGGFFSIFDPCDTTRITANPNRAANCALDPDIPVVPFPSQTNVAVEGETAGNPNLMPEQSESYTVGFILQPRWLPGFALTLDYYDILIEDAIATAGAQNILNSCYDSPGGLNAQYCDLFTRSTDPTDPFVGNINFIQDTYINLSALEAKGWDLEMTYRTNVEEWTRNVSWLDWATGSLAASLRANYVQDLNFYQFQNQPDVVNVATGEVNNPEWRVLTRLTYAQGPVSVTWEARYEGEQFNYEQTPGVGNPEIVDIASIDGLAYHDLIVNYKLPALFGSEGETEVFLGINNVLDEEIPESSSIQTAQYEYLGRRFFGGLRVKF